ncbi:MAG TPA: prepilin-type N-terminal cleavage/methylation domain-containing protein [Gallionella sp.]
MCTSKGFTLVEMIMVIVITGIIGGMVAVFLKAPIQQYMDVSRRADMTDIADTALRRIGRDLRLALPNSVRVDPSGHYIEFLPTTGGGRYRAAAAPSGVSAGCVSLAGDVLDFTAADTCFEVLGAMPVPAVNVGDQIVVYNLGIPGASAYTGNASATDNRRTVSVVGTHTLSITSAFSLPFDSPSHRFQVITTPVSYVCDGAGTLWRYWGYAIQDVQTKTDSIAELDALVSPATATRGKAQLATNVSSCNFSYNANVVAQRSGLVTMNLGITESGETVTLYSATHVSNMP